MSGENQENNQNLSDEDKIKDFLFGVTISRISLIQANQIVEKFVAENVDSEFAKMNDAQKEQILNIVRQQETGIVTPNKQIIVP